MSAGELLNVLAQETHRRCLSDMHGISPNEFGDAMGTIDINRYSIEDWQYALSYVFGKPVHLDSRADIIGFLKKIK